MSYLMALMHHDGNPERANIAIGGLSKSNGRQSIMEVSGMPELMIKG